MTNRTVTRLYRFPSRDDHHDGTLLLHEQVPYTTESIELTHPVAVIETNHRDTEATEANPHAPRTHRPLEFSGPFSLCLRHYTGRMNPLHRIHKITMSLKLLSL